jgi:diketogulonate reductase-like aldo/keto reductase
MDASSTVNLLTGSRMPVIGLGTWQLKYDTPEAIMHALEIGYRMIDTSGDYGTQPGIAEGLRQTNVPREEIYIVTKVEEDEDAYLSARQQVAELGLRYVDLILIHRPPPVGAGEELWRGLIRAREEGITRDIGVSNYRTEQIDDLIESSEEPPVVNQIEWSPFGHSEAMYSYCQSSGIIIQAYSPLTRETHLQSKVLNAIAQEHGKTPEQILIRWNIERGVVPLPKANDLDHQKENVDVFDFFLSQGDIDALNGLNEYYSALGELSYV